MTQAQFIRVRGIVQGVGFRPYVFRLAQAHALTGWVLNADEGVQIHVEGAPDALRAFVDELGAHPPPAAAIASLDVIDADPAHYDRFAIRDSRRGGAPTTRISPDLPVCDACLRELLDQADRRYRYPYINCTECGPRYSIIRALPYDRAETTMAAWPICEACAAEFHDVADRRFHAQPVACARCGPLYLMLTPAAAPVLGEGAIAAAVRMLRDGAIVAVKGLGGYHLACDASRADVVALLRDRKYRKEKPFAVMVKDADVARELVELTPAGERLLTSVARPIVLARARAELPGVAPGNSDLGVMLPYTPLHHLLLADGAPRYLVMTSANRASEPIAYDDDEALETLEGIADAFLVGERPIARRLDDSVVRDGAHGPQILRRSRGYAPGAVALLPSAQPILALGADLKNTITLVVDGQAYVSQHIGDLEHAGAADAFHETVRDWLAMYDVGVRDLIVVADAHPGYVSTAFASGLASTSLRRVQHHRAHIASVLAERTAPGEGALNEGALDERVLGVALDGTGYGDDGTIWGGEFFAGSVAGGLERVAHLCPAMLPGGDAAARFPVQAAAGFLAALHERPDVTRAPFEFPDRYTRAVALVEKNVRTFTTTSAGRLFDAAAALTGFVREVTYEGQAAIWLEQLARRSLSLECYPTRFDGRELDWRPLLRALIDARMRGDEPADIARAFHRGLARGLAEAIVTLSTIHRVQTVVLSGGVWQNELLLADLDRLLDDAGLRVWTHAAVPCNDGGISLGQAALAIDGNREA